MEGWFKTYRKIIDSPIFDNADALKMWTWILAKASHKDRVLIVGTQNVEIKKGEFIFGRKMAAEKLKYSENKTYRLLKLIEKMGMIEVKSNNKFSVIKVVNWGFYQDGSAQSEQQIDNKQTTDRQQIDNKQTTDRHKQELYNSNTSENLENEKEITAILIDEAQFLTYIIALLTIVSSPFKSILGFDTKGDIPLSS